VSRESSWSDVEWMLLEFGLQPVFGLKRAIA
jgi:hypothetical protein